MTFAIWPASLFSLRGCSPQGLRPQGPPPDTTNKRLQELAVRIDLCRRRQGCGDPDCGPHAVGRPTHQVGADRGILVVGEAPAADGWWLTGRAFYRRSSSGRLELSRTGANLNRCLAVLGTRIERVGFVEAVRCRPSTNDPWHPGERVRQICRQFLLEHLLAVRPRLVLPLGLVATASCMKVTVGWRPATLDAIAGVPVEWAAPWGLCWIVPLYHPSPANAGRWPWNVQHLREFLAANPSFSGSSAPSAAGRKR